MVTEREVSVSISLYYFYLQVKSVFNSKIWKIWGRWSAKYINLFFMPIFYCRLRVPLVYERVFLDVPLQWMHCEGRASMPARLVLACLYYYFCRPAAVSQGSQMKAVKCDFSKWGRYLQKKLSKISHHGESMLPKATGILQIHLTAVSAASTGRLWGQWILPPETAALLLPLLNADRLGLVAKDLPGLVSSSHAPYTLMTCLVRHFMFACNKVFIRPL